MHASIELGTMILGLSLSLTSCLTTVAPDGTRTRRVDPEARIALLDLAREIYVPSPAPRITREK